MQTKLTLRLGQNLIDEAKRYSRKRGKSISQLVADYFYLLVSRTKDKKSEADLPPLTASLKGSWRNNSMGLKDYRRYLEDKYR